MAFLIFLCKLHLKIIYSLLKLLPVDCRKVVFLSRNSNAVPLDFRLLNEELNKQCSTIRTVFLTRRVGRSLPQLAGYYFHVLRQLYHIATTRVCVLDSYIIPVSVLKHRKGLCVIQLWHAMGAVKKFGYQTLDMPYGRSRKVSLMMRMHQGYDWVVAGSQRMIPYYVEAFNTPAQRFLPIGLPRIDYLVAEKDRLEKKLLEKHPAFKTKPMILYVPTFRTELDNGLESLTERVDFERYTLVIKKHPNDKRAHYDQRVTYIEGTSSMALLCAADYVITDYSAISIEAAALEKRVYFYVYDYDRYSQANGLNLDLHKEMPGCVFRDASALIEAIERDDYNFDAVRGFKDKYVANDGKAVSRIGGVVLKNIESV